VLCPVLLLCVVERLEVSGLDESLGFTQVRRFESRLRNKGRLQSGPAAPPRRQIVGQFPPASVVKVLLLENQPLTPMDGAP
jgi:hypothetical protein